MNVVRRHGLLLLRRVERDGEAGERRAGTEECGTWPSHQPQRQRSSRFAQPLRRYCRLDPAVMVRRGFESSILRLQPLVRAMIINSAR